jgi:hypothetical protein
LAGGCVDDQEMDLWLRLFVFFLSKREEGAAATVLEK